MPSQSPVRRSLSLTRLLASFGLLNISEWGFVTALSVYAFRVGGTFDVGLIGLRLLAGALSSALIAPLLINRSGVLSWIAFGRAVLLGVAATLAIKHAAFPLILLFVLFDSVVAAGYRPAQARVIPSLARSPEELTRAVAGTSTAKTLGQAAGALIGGVAVESVSPGVAMAGEACVMLAALACGLSLRQRATVQVEAGTRTLRDGLAAFPSVLRDADAWPLVVASVLRTLVRGLWAALLVAVALRLLRAGSSGVGLIQAATALGAFVALPLTASQIGRSRLALPCAISFVGAGVTVGLISTATALPVVAALVFVWGVSMAMADATSLSLLHRLLTTDAFSRTVAVMESLKLVSEGAGALIAPGLVALFGLRAAIAIAGVPLPLLMLVTWARVQQSDERAAGRGAIVSLLHRVRLFRGLDMASLEQLAAHAESVTAPAGIDVITEGERGDRFYVIESGEAEVLIGGLPANRLGPGDDFGERALLRDTPRTATVRAATEMWLQAVDRDAFLQAVTGERGLRVHVGDLTGVPLSEVLRPLPAFASLGSDALKRLAHASQSTELPSGSVVFEQGDSADLVYVILSGRVELRRDGALNSVLEPGDIFGELSVLHGTSRLSQAVAANAVTVAVLPATAVLDETSKIPSEQATPSR